MAKVPLSDVNSRYGSVGALNANFDSIQQGFENTLSRDGTGPNAMEAPLDMNGQPILNAGTVNAANLVINGSPVEPAGLVTVAATVETFEFTATAGQTSFSIAPFTPSSIDSFIIEVDGISLRPTSTTLNGSTIGFPALQLGQQVVVRVFTRDIGGIPQVPFANLLPGLAEDTTGGATDEASFHFRRRANYSGGTPGFVNSALRADTFVESAPGLPSTAASFEWAACFVLHNRSSFGENVGAYRQGIKYAGAGPTWGGVDEIIDWSSGNPTSGAVGCELSFSANGTDTNRVRVGYDMAIRKSNGAGSSPVVSWGYRIQTETGSKVNRGYGFAPNCNVDVAFDATESAATQAAFAMAQNQPICFNAAYSRKLFHNGNSWQFTNVSNDSLWGLNDDFSLTANNVQLLGTRKTGWGTATGTATRTTFVTSTVTTAQLAERVKALIDDLISHGLIGA